MRPIGLTTLVRRRRGFSLIEMLVVVAVLAILATMGYSALWRGRTVSKDTVCRNNLKQIAVALGLYYNDYHTYPSENLPESLAQYVGHNSKLFVCPADPDPQGDSYSKFYVARMDDGTQDYVCGCPHHVGEKSTITLFSSASAQLLETRPVLWNDQEVAPGTSVGSGVLSFGDGSTCTIPSGMVVQLIHSFRMHDGRFYSLIGLDINETGTLDVEVTPGSRFEVVTPAAIAGVQGTRFQVIATIEGDLYCVKIDVTEGEVLVKNRWIADAGELLKAGNSKKLQQSRSNIYQKLQRGWLNRRRHFSDDYLYETASNDGTPVRPHD